jgi:hypothetical protein
MPIRLNLLAEAKAAEEQRRRDPVKRAIWGAALALASMLAWSSSLQLKALLANNEVSRIEGSVRAQTQAYQQVLDNRKKLDEMVVKLTALNQLATNRHLNGSVLNALQQISVPDVRLLKFRTEQIYVATEAVKPKAGEPRTKMKPPTATEKITLRLEGNDASANLGDGVNKLRDAVSAHPFFRAHLAGSNAVTLKSMSSPQFLPGTTTPCVVFAIECAYPEKTR